MWYSSLSSVASSSSSPFLSVANKSGFDPMLPDLKSNRGGSLIYSPTTDKGDFSTFVQPLMTSTRNQAIPQITNEAWIQHMIHLHSTETTGKRNRASRGGVKRKRAENEELVWSLENILEGLQKNRRGFIGCEMLGEEQAVALEHLRLCYDGNVEGAEFDILVKLSGGQGQFNSLNTFTY